MIFEKDMFPRDFKQYIWRDNENRKFIFISIIAFFSLYNIFLRCYPYPNFLPDSYSYIDAATQNVNLNMWPVGYSKFLRFLSVFNQTDKGLFFVQYLILITSMLFFLITIRYLINPGKLTIRILFVLLILNPFWLYVSYFVSSDALFASTSLLWLTTLLWIIYFPKKDLILFHGLILFFVFSIRYNALYYPLISATIIILNKSTLKQKLINLSLACIPVLWFIVHTVMLYQEKTSTVQFSPFGGWQLASNALYMYAHVSPKTNQPVPKKLKDLHLLTVKHLDSLNHLPPNKRPDQQLGIYYLWDEKAPLKQYLMIKYKGDSTTPYLKRWARQAPIYSQYGAWLIKQYPIEFAEFYLLPNLINYYAPSPEFLGTYNMGADTVDPGGVKWFRYKTNKVHGFSKDKNIQLTSIFPPMLAIINIFFITSFIGFIFLNGFKEISINYKKVLWLFISVWLINLAFSVFASPIVLRYQVFPFIFTLTFGGILLSFLIKKSFTTQVDNPTVIQSDILPAQ